MRAPDVAFVASNRLIDCADHVGYLPLTADLVAEVMSPGDSSSEVETKMQAWLDAGVKVVLVVDPLSSTVRMHRNNQMQVHSGGLVDLGDVLSELELGVAELFAGRTCKRASRRYFPPPLHRSRLYLPPCPLQ